MSQNELYMLNPKKEKFDFFASFFVGAFCHTGTSMLTFLEPALNYDFYLPILAWLYRWKNY